MCQASLQLKLTGTGQKEGMDPERSQCQRGHHSASLETSLGWTPVFETALQILPLIRNSYLLKRCVFYLHSVVKP